MLTYPASPVPSSPVRHSKLMFAVASMILGEGPVVSLAPYAGVSRQWLYTVSHRVEAAVSRDGRSLSVAAGEIDRLKQENSILLASNVRLREELEKTRTRLRDAVEVTRRRIAGVILTCFASNVSLRGMRRILRTAFGSAIKMHASTIGRFLKDAGREARRLLDAARTQVRDRLSCVMADDTFFHRRDIKGVADPESMAILNVGRWDGTSGLDWEVWLEEYQALELLVSDLGKDLVAAARSLGIAHVADWFHEKRWFDKKVLRQLSSREAELRKKALSDLDRATRVEGAGRRRDPAAALLALEQADAAEKDFYAAVAAEDLLWSMYEAINPKTGLLWTRQDADAIIDEVKSIFSGINHELSRVVLRHLTSFGDHMNAHRIRLEHLPVPLRPEATWTAQEVLNGILRLRKTRKELEDLEPFSSWEEWVAREKEANALEEQLNTQCLDLFGVTRLIAHEIRHPKRSSSGIESLNSRFRVLQMVHRSVSDDMLALLSFAWNLTPGRDGRSPWTRLGVDIGQGDKPWHEVLLQSAHLHLA